MVQYNISLGNLTIQSNHWLLHWCVCVCVCACALWKGKRLPIDYQTFLTDIYYRWTTHDEEFERLKALITHSPVRMNGGVIEPLSLSQDTVFRQTELYTFFD